MEQAEAALEHGVEAAQHSAVICWSRPAKLYVLLWAGAAAGMLIQVPGLQALTHRAAVAAAALFHVVRVRAEGVPLFNVSWVDCGVTL